MELLLHYTLPCPDILSYLVVDLGSSSSLAFALIGRSQVIDYHLREIGSVVGSRLAICAIVVKNLV